MFKVWNWCLNSVRFESDSGRAQGGGRAQEDCKGTLVASIWICWRIFRVWEWAASPSGDIGSWTLLLNPKDSSELWVLYGSTQKWFWNSMIVNGLIKWLLYWFYYDSKTNGFKRRTCSGVLRGCVNALKVNTRFGNSKFKASRWILEVVYRSIAKILRGYQGLEWGNRTLKKM